MNNSRRGSINRLTGNTVSAILMGIFGVVALGMISSIISISVPIGVVYLIVHWFIGWHVVGDWIFKVLH